MSDYYIKKGSKYIKVGWGAEHIQYPGIWLAQFYEGGSSFNNLTIRVADLPQPVELQKFVEFFLMKDKLTGFLMDICDLRSGVIDYEQKPRTSKEPLFLGKDRMGKKAKVGIYNIAMADLAEEICKFLFKEFGNPNIPKTKQDDRAR